MKRVAKLSLIIVVCTLTLAMVCKVKAQVSAHNVKTFFDSEMPGIKIQVNATAETRPTENLSAWLLLTPQTAVYVESFELDIYGFLNGTDKVSIGNITDHSFSLNGNSTEYNMTFIVPDGVWGITFGEITLTYSANLGGLELMFPKASGGFYMTQVDNTFVESLVTQLRGLNESYDRLNDTYYNLTGEYLELQQNYTMLQGSMNELDNTRRVAVILAITTVFFVATTVFMVMRRPRESW
jgi:hypothetical protein